MKADADALRARAVRTPALPLERVAITINPPQMLGDVSAAAVDKQGNIYISIINKMAAAGNKMAAAGANTMKTTASENMAAFSSTARAV
jgi:hypothetical protein